MCSTCNTRIWKGGIATCRGSFVKCASSGTVILKGESAENKSTQQSWPTFMLECFQRQQSLFSYAINCLNRLPVEFLMCYKVRVCFPRVDSTQAYCVRPCPVISTGLGWKNFSERKTFHVLLSSTLWTIVHKACLFSRFLPQWHLSITSALYITGLVPRALEDVFVLIFSIQGGCENWRGSLAVCRAAKQIIPQHSGELDSSVGTSRGCCLKLSRHCRAFTCRSQTLLPIHLNA